MLILYIKSVDFTKGLSYDGPFFTCGDEGFLKLYKL